MLLRRYVTCIHTFDRCGAHGYEPNPNPLSLGCSRNESPLPGPDRPGVPRNEGQGLKSVWLASPKGHKPSKKSHCVEPTPRMSMGLACPSRLAI